MSSIIQEVASHLDTGKFGGKLGIQQRVLPAYRRAFFDMLASACEGGVELFAGKPQPEEAIQVTDTLEIASLVPANNIHIGTISSSYYFLWQRGLLIWLARYTPDVLIVEANPRYLSNRWAIRWMHAHGKPVIGWGLGAPSVEGQILAGFHRWLRRTYLLSCDALIAYSRGGAQEFQELGFSENKIFIATNAVAPPPSFPPPVRTPVFSAQPVVLFIGRLQARKRVDLLLHACAGLPERLKPRLVIVGDGPARAGLEQLAREIYPAAEFPGPRRAQELEPYFQMADLFVLPGTGGLAVQEAMAHGLPVLVAEADGTQVDMVRPDNGWLVPPDDLDALQRALQEALADPARLRRMGSRSYQIALDEVNIQSMARVFLQAIEMVQSNPVG